MIFHTPAYEGNSIRFMRMTPVEMTIDSLLMNNILRD